MENPFIIGQKVYLRPVEIEDAEYLVRWNSNPDVRYSFFIGFSTNQFRQKELIENLYKDKELILFIIMSVSEDRPVGLTGYYRIDYPHAVDA